MHPRERAAAYLKLPKMVLSAKIWPEGNGYVAECSELGTCSQGNTSDEAFHNLIEATELFLLCADQGEITERLKAHAAHEHQEVRSFEMAH